MGEEHEPEAGGQEPGALKDPAHRIAGVVMKSSCWAVGLGSIFMHWAALSVSSLFLFLYHTSCKTVMRRMRMQIIESTHSDRDSLY